MAADDPVKDVLGMLSVEQLEALRKALGQPGSETESKGLSDAQIRTLRTEAAGYRAAQKQVAEAVGVLWNARLDMAISAGDAKDIREAMMRPVQFYDNCNCTHPNGSSAGSW